MLFFRFSQATLKQAGKQADVMVICVKFRQVVYIRRFQMKWHWFFSPDDANPEQKTRNVFMTSKAWERWLDSLVNKEEMLR